MWYLVEYVRSERFCAALNAQVSLHEVRSVVEGTVRRIARFEPTQFVKDFLHVASHRDRAS